MRDAFASFMAGLAVGGLIMLVAVATSPDLERLRGYEAEVAVWAVELGTCQAEVAGQANRIMLLEAALKDSLPPVLLEFLEAILAEE
jgi:hypothetical protein